jgi:hypothetical protein
VNQSPGGAMLIEKTAYFPIRFVSPVGTFFGLKSNLNLERRWA